MNISLITDTHFNFKKANKSFHDYFLKFYDEIFFPKLIEKNIKTVIHLGDTFDNRKGIDYWALKWAKENVYDKFSELGITVYNIVGNHDAYYKNTNNVNAVDTLLNEYDNIIKVSEVVEANIGGMDTILIPWICSDNQEKVFSAIKKTKAKVLFGHLELSGFLTYPGHVQEDGINKEIFQKFDKVFSGHYHTRSDDGKIFYIGNPYQMFWSDVNDDRGFSILDTKNCNLEFIKNSFSMFEKIYYDDTDVKEFDFSILSNKMVKVIVKNKNNQLQFDGFIEKVIKSDCLDLKIVEASEVYDESIDCCDESIEDTLTILNKYVEESEITLNKNIIKKIIQEIYRESLELQ